MASTVYVNDDKRGKTVERFARQIGCHCRLLPWYQTQHNGKKENDDKDGNNKEKKAIAVCVCVVRAATLARVSPSLARSPTGTHYPHRNAIHNKSTSLRATPDGFLSITGIAKLHGPETHHPPSSVRQPTTIAIVFGRDPDVVIPSRFVTDPFVQTCLELDFELLVQLVETLGDPHRYMVDLVLKVSKSDV